MNSGICPLTIYVILIACKLLGRRREKADRSARRLAQRSIRHRLRHLDTFERRIDARHLCT